MAVDVPSLLSVANTWIDPIAVKRKKVRIA